MGVVINVFYTGKKDEDRFISFLAKHGFVHYVDYMRWKDEAWMIKNCKKGFYKCCFEEGLHRGQSWATAASVEDELPIEDPNFFYVLVVDCKEEHENFYYYIEEFLQDCMNEEVDSACDKKTWLLDMPEPQVIGAVEVVKEKTKRKDEDLQEEDTKCGMYTIDYEDIGDCRLYQLTKPNTDRPYTVLIRDFKKFGSKRLFSSMRLFDSWGVSKGDTAFLEQVWKTYLGFSGQPNFDEMLEEHIKACDEGEPEPKVWRVHMEEVIRQNKF